MPCRIPDILLEAFLVVMVATILPTSLLLGVGFLLMWKKFHAPCISHTRNHYNCSFKCFGLSTTCTTCRLALLALLLLCGSSMTSAEEEKPKLQLSYEYEAAKMKQVTIKLTEQLGMESNVQKRCKLHKWKSSERLRRQGEILQYASMKQSHKGRIWWNTCDYSASRESRIVRLYFFQCKIQK